MVEIQQMVKTMECGKQCFQQMMLGKLNIHMQKNEFGSLPHTIYKTQNGANLTLRARTIKFLKG